EEAEERGLKAARLEEEMKRRLDEGPPISQIAGDLQVSRQMVWLFKSRILLEQWVADLKRPGRPPGDERFQSIVNDTLTLAAIVRTPYVSKRLSLDRYTLPSLPLNLDQVDRQKLSETLEDLMHMLEAIEATYQEGDLPFNELFSITPYTQELALAGDLYAIFRYCLRYARHTGSKKDGEDGADYIFLESLAAEAGIAPSAIESIEKNIKDRSVPSLENVGKIIQALSSDKFKLDYLDHAIKDKATVVTQLLINKDTVDRARTIYVAAQEVNGAAQSDISQLKKKTHKEIVDILVPSKGDDWQPKKTASAIFGYNLRLTRERGVPIEEVKRKRRGEGRNKSISITTDDIASKIHRHRNFILRLEENNPQDVKLTIFTLHAIISALSSGDFILDDIKLGEWRDFDFVLKLLFDKEPLKKVHKVYCRAQAANNGEGLAVVKKGSEGFYEKVIAEELYERSVVVVNEKGRGERKRLKIDEKRLTREDKVLRRFGQNLSVIMKTRRAADGSRLTYKYLAERLHISVVTLENTIGGKRPTAYVRLHNIVQTVSGLTGDSFEGVLEDLFKEPGSTAPRPARRAATRQAAMSPDMGEEEPALSREKWITKVKKIGVWNILLKAVGYDDCKLIGFVGDVNEMFDRPTEGYSGDLSDLDYRTAVAELRKIKSKKLPYSAFTYDPFDNGDDEHPGWIEHYEVLHLAQVIRQSKRKLSQDIREPVTLEYITNFKLGEIIKGLDDISEANRNLKDAYEELDRDLRKYSETFKADESTELFAWIYSMEKHPHFFEGHLWKLKPDDQEEIEFLRMSREQRDRIAIPINKSTNRFIKAAANCPEVREFLRRYYEKLSSIVPELNIQVPTPFTEDYPYTAGAEETPDRDPDSHSRRRSMSPQATEGSGPTYKKYTHMTMAKFREMVERLKRNKEEEIEPEDEEELTRFGEVLGELRECIPQLRKASLGLGADFIVCFKAYEATEDILVAYEFPYAPIVKTRFIDEAGKPSTIFGSTEYLHEAVAIPEKRYAKHHYIVTRVAGEYFIIDLAAGQFLGEGFSPETDVGVFIVPLDDLGMYAWPYAMGVTVESESERELLLQFVDGDEVLAERILHPERADPDSHSRQRGMSPTIIDPRGLSTATQSQVKESLTQDARMLLKLTSEYLPAEFIAGRHYQLRINASEDSIEYKIAKVWWDKIQEIYKDSGATFETIKPNGSKDKEWLVNVNCYRKRELIAESYVGANHRGSPHSLMGLLNIAFAAGNIEKDTKRWNGEYGFLIDFINDQYRMLTKREDNLIDKNEEPQKIIQRISEEKNTKESGLYIELPPIDVIEFDIELLPEMAEEALRAV
ncbi:hypothetical protein OAA99_00785, partial [Omnitrophica bacterium]|nr:hypothetical protein [Candidatus Omnitrophota bacterium]